MPNISVLDMKGGVVGEMTLADSVFAAPINQPVLHQAVVAYLANQRQGNQSALTRAEVRGGGAKPWRQKGTGRSPGLHPRPPFHPWRRGVRTQAPLLQSEHEQENEGHRHEVGLLIQSRRRRDEGHRQG
jgi:ribosomal protein L4